MHKTPTKFRFIIRAPKWAIKPLSKSISPILKLISSQIQTHFYSGVKSFGVLQNNEPVIKNIRKLNCRSRGKGLSTFDLSTLYTKIPHHKLLSVLNELIDFCFQGGLSKHVVVTKYGAKWVSNPSKHDITFDKAKIKIGLQYLMDNCLFSCGNTLFQ